ncbi:uncharacterized protein LOC122793949 [Protopterus annectens]|uniref:uncharacterized protein LOC122793949 n=1 Tax=Protopterus annectens TaxID=7888 RepID=UPI001CFC4067|nr:uncharacterized protein LOC122793949 [Protopterus annectens]
MEEAHKYLEKVLECAGLGEDCNEFVKKIVRKMENSMFDFSLPEMRKGRSKQSEHIINQGVLKVYYNIVTTFLQKCNFHNLSTVQQLGEDLQVCNEIKNPLVTKYIKTKIPEEWLKNNPSLLKIIQTNINEKWKADIPTDVEYMQLNEKEYGAKIKSLVDMASSFMKCWHDGKHGVLILQGNIREVLTRLTEQQLYIDPVALIYWLKEHPNGKDDIEKALSVVRAMFTSLNPCGNENVLINWTHEITDEISKP